MVVGEPKADQNSVQPTEFLLGRSGFDPAFRTQEVA